MTKLCVDPCRSKGAYPWDTVTEQSYLDLHGMYSSSPLGWSHPALMGDFEHEAGLLAGVKIALGAVTCKTAERFRTALMGHPSCLPFSDVHFCQTGALAVEAAIKTAMFATGRGGSVLTSESAFHGINGYGGMLASYRGPSGPRLRGFPQGSLRIRNARLDGDSVRREAGTKNSLAAVIVEPIECTVGDRVIDPEILHDIREACDETGTPLIFDEIQTGFGGTGTFWYHEQIGVVPDILVFGKKAQVSGILVREDFCAIFEEPDRLSVTWDGDAIDMLRATYILRAYEEYQILANVRAREAQLVDGIPGLRHAGLLMALDFVTREERDAFVERMSSTLMLPTGERCVRWRPNLAITETECTDVIERAWRAAAEPVCV